MSKLRNTIYYEFRTIDDPATVVQTGMRTLGSTSITTGIDTVPSMTLTIPLEDLPSEELEKIELGQVVEPRLQRYLMTVYVQVNGELKYRFNGTIDRMKINYADYTAEFSLSHKVARMREWQMPVNYTVKNVTVSQVLSADGTALGYPNPTVGDSGAEFSMQSYNQEIFFRLAEGAGDVQVSLTFGANNKLAALSELLNNTENLHFAVDLSSEQDTILISSFSENDCSPNTLISPFPFEEDECETAPYNFVAMLTEPTFDVDYTNHFNRAVVFCGDIQDGVSHLTLGSLFGQEPIAGFPVGKYDYELNQQPETQWDDNGAKINNEKVYQNYEAIAYSQNGNREYYVQDTEQLNRDSGIVLNTTYNFNDLYPIPSLKEDIDGDGEMEELVITDVDRTEIVHQAYIRAVRRLKAQRPQRAYQFNCTALPMGMTDGEKIRLLYSKNVRRPSEEEGCDTDTLIKIVNVDECLYLTKRTITFDSAMNEITTVTLDGELRARDINPTEVELREAAEEGGETGYTKQHADLGKETYSDEVYKQYGKQMIQNAIQNMLPSPSTGGPRG